MLAFWYVNEETSYSHTVGPVDYTNWYHWTKHIGWWCSCAIVLIGPEQKELFQSGNGFFLCLRQTVIIPIGHQKDRNVGFPTDRSRGRRSHSFNDRSKRTCHLACIACMHIEACYSFMILCSWFVLYNVAASFDECGDISWAVSRCAAHGYTKRCLLVHLWLVDDLWQFWFINTNKLLIWILWSFKWWRTSVHPNSQAAPTHGRRSVLSGKGHQCGRGSTRLPGWAMVIQDHLW